MKRTRLKLLVCLTVGIPLLALSISPRVIRGQGSPVTGDPLPGLTASELELFKDGKMEFEEEEDVSKGLGPIFNGRSCGECHSTPATGGGSAVTVMRVGRLVGDRFDPLEGKGGSLIQLMAIATRCQERIPREANVITRRLTTPIFGAGLIEAIPDDAIIANAARQPRDFRGRVNMVLDKASGQMHVGRFGWKSQQATLMSFGAEAYLNEMGITNRLFSEENAPNGDGKLLADCDGVPDPEDTLDPKTKLFGIDKFANFMRFLGPPARGPLSQDVVDGRQIFNRAECDHCHVPTFITGANKIAALDRKPVNAFSDFLLHDVGKEGADNIVQGDAKGNEMRTTPLWGLRDRSPLLHDGAAVTIEQSILLGHFGQATSSLQRFEALSRSDKDKLIAFLNSL